jgi:hypothetical protein
MITISLLISHVLSDLILQTDKIVEEKSTMKKSGYFWHAIGLIGTSAPILFFLKLSSMGLVFICICLITLTHLILDFCKEVLQNKLASNNDSRYYNVGIFIADQILHILTVIIITSVIINDVTIEFNFINDFFINVVLQNGSLNYADFKMIFLIGYIAFSGAYLIPLLFEVIYAKIPNYGTILNSKLKEDLNQGEYGFIDEVKTGKWIGILERILIIIFIYTNQLATIGFIVAMKSLARFKMMDNKIFSEYYLLGTFISMVYTFVAYALFTIE